MNYYNEIDKSAANWIRQLIKDGLIPPGDVDERSIVDVKPEELKSYAQCHFFAGIAGWSYALQLAGWPSDRPVWTGSCPCQPFSAAGKGLGQSDERHLWPAFFNLIRECRPQQVFGEQVASAIGHGWLDGVSADLESEGYACGATVLGAHSVGAPHIRQRTWWGAFRMADANSRGFKIGEKRDRQATQNPTNRHSCWTDADKCSQPDARWVGESEQPRLEGHPRHGDNGREPGRLNQNAGGSTAEAGRDGGFWSNFDMLPCRDGKSRRIEPGTSPLAHGVSGRVGLLRGYGNAIVPQVGAEFVMAFMEVEQMNQSASIQ